VGVAFIDGASAAVKAKTDSKSWTEFDGDE
jgi:hypothetical protein